MFRLRDLASFAFAFGAMFVAPSVATAAPDIVVFLVDDLGPTSIGPVKRAVAVPTPNIDAIGAQGAIFYNGYAAPVCVPARTMLMTGKNPQRASAGAVTANGPQPPGTILTLAEMLRAHGYATAAVGKWHLGFTFSQHPLSQGFDSFLGFKGITPDYTGHDPDAPLYVGRTPTINTGDVTTTLVNEAVRILSEPRDKPLLLYLPFTGVHDPLQGTLAQRLAEVDAAVGRVMDATKPDTLVFYASDNGRASGSNKPFKGGKYDIWEGGVRVQLYLKWAGHVAPGQTIYTPASLVDAFATALSAAGVPIPAGLDSYNLLEPLPSNRPVFFKALKPEPGIAVRRGQWKLYRNYKGVAVQLYDISTDKGETKNVAAGNQRVVNELTTLLNQFTASLSN